jgi:hypothetical protein
MYRLSSLYGCSHWRELRRNLAKEHLDAFESRVRDGVDVVAALQLIQIP